MAITTIFKYIDPYGQIAKLAFLGCLNVVRKPLRLLAVMLMLMLLILLASNFIARDWLELGQIFKKHMTPLIFMNFLKIFEKILNFATFATFW